MPVQVLACPVVPHRGAWVGMAGRDLDMAQVNASIEHGRYESVSQHARVRPGDLNGGELGEATRRRRVAACRSVRVLWVFSRIGPRTLEPTARSMARPTAGGNGTRTILVLLPHTRITL